MSTVMDVQPGMIVASTSARAVQANWNQSRAVLAVEDQERTKWDRTLRAHYKVPVKRALLTSEGQGGMQTWVTLTEEGSLRNHRLVSAPDAHVAALVACFEGIETKQSYCRRRYWAQPPTPVDRLVRTALLFPRAQDGGPRAKAALELDQDAVRALAERLLTLTQIVEQNALVAESPIGAGYAPGQPAAAAAADLAAEVEGIVARLEAATAEAQWGDGE
jgi:hypothetical protein